MILLRSHFLLAWQISLVKLPCIPRALWYLRLDLSMWVEFQNLFHKKLRSLSRYLIYFHRISHSFFHALNMWMMVWHLCLLSCPCMPCHMLCLGLSTSHCTHASYKVSVVVCIPRPYGVELVAVGWEALLIGPFRLSFCLICCLAPLLFYFTSHDIVSDILFDPTTCRPSSQFFKLINLKGWNS